MGVFGPVAGTVPAVCGPPVQMRVTVISRMSDTSTSRPKAIAFDFVLVGELPLTGAEVRIALPPARLVRDEIQHTAKALGEALRASQAYRLQRPALRLEVEGEVLRETRLIEAPGKDDYLVEEKFPGQGAGRIPEWIAGCAISFARVRSAQAALKVAAELAPSGESAA